MKARDHWQDIEEIKTLKARYIRFGDTKQWDGLAKLLTDDFAALFEIAPRFSKDQPRRVEISGRDLFINTWASALVGVVTMHDVFLPEITLISPTAATGIWRMHDLVKMPKCLFEGWGHYQDEYAKQQGVWMIKASRVSMRKSSGFDLEYPTSNLSDKVIVITGAASGIGEACSRLFAQEGAKVVLADRDETGGKNVVAAIKAKGGIAEFIATDVTDEKAIEAMVGLAVRKWGGLDGAVNAAGIAGNPAPVVELSAAEWRVNFEVMLLGVALCMKYEIAAMLKRGGGSIVNIASLGGLDGVPMMAHYSAAKHGVVGVTKSAALETGTAGVRVNAICPGLIDTPLYRAKLAEGVDYSGVVRNIALGGSGQATEVADTAQWLLSPRSSYVTGQTIIVDGGLMIGAFGRPG
jgi:NAD(P)-dependent dehydrogenase (short-subunit alcohol dehydrogenase family)